MLQRAHGHATGTVPTRGHRRTRRHGPEGLQTIRLQRLPRRVAAGPVRAMSTNQLLQPSDPLLSVEEVAAYVGSPLSSTYKWSRQRYPHYPVCSRLPNGRLVARRSDVDAWLEELAG